MTTTNGHAPLHRLKQELREARAQRALIREQALTERAQRELMALQESYTTGYPYAGWFPLDYPQSAFDPLSAPGPWLPVGGYRGSRKGGAQWPVLRTETDMDRQREMARWLADTNPFTQGVVNRLRNYGIRTGFKYQVLAEKDARPADVAQRVANVVQEAVDSFLIRNKLGSPRLDRWADREREIFVRAIRDGEVALRTFVQRDATTQIRPIEPEAIRQPPGTEDNFSWGIETDPDDIETKINFCVANDVTTPEDYESVPAEEVFWYKRNTDCTVKRGISDFFAVRESFDLSCKLIRNLQCGAGNQAAISWIEEYKLASGASITGGVNVTKDALQPSSVHPVTGKNYNFTMYEPGLVIKTGQGKEFKPPPPANNAAPHVTIVQAGLRSIAQRWDMPEYMLSADAGNAAFASQMVAGAPFVITMESEQGQFADLFLDVIWFAVKQLADAGRILLDGYALSLKEIMALVDIHCTPPQISNVDKMQNANINEIRLRNRVMSIQTWRAEDGLDDDRERQNLREEPVTQPSVGMNGQGVPGTGLLPRWAVADADRATQESLRGRVIRLLEAAEKKAGQPIPAPAPREPARVQDGGGKGIMERMRAGR